MRLSISVITLLLAGCSTARYDADYEKALAAYRDRAPFAVLQPQPTGFDRVSLSLPLGFAAVVDGPPQVEGGPPLKPDPSRLRPPFLEELPGYRAAHDRRFTAEGAELPVSVSVGELPATEGRPEVEKLILDQARAAEDFKGREPFPTWSDRPVQPRNGGPAAWRVLTLAGSQVFESVLAGNQEYKRWDGTCEIWLSADPKQEVITLLAWRVPDKVAGSLPVPLSQLAETVARTVAIGPATDPAEEPQPQPQAEPQPQAASQPKPGAAAAE